MSKRNIIPGTIIRKEFQLVLYEDTMGYKQNICAHRHLKISNELARPNLNKPQYVTLLISLQSFV